MNSIRFGRLSWVLLGLLASACTLETEGLQSRGQQSVSVDPCLGSGCDEDPAEVCEPRTVDLLAGRTIRAGSVEVVNDDLDLVVEYSASNGWRLAETHLAIGNGLVDLPMNRSGNPKVGHFPYHAEHDPPVETFTYVIALDELAAAGIDVGEGSHLVIAAHAVVQMPGAPPRGTREETAWGEGVGFPGHNWAMYFDYIIQDCEQDEEVQYGYTTYTQAGWDTAAALDLMAANWDAMFDEDGLLIGDPTCGHSVVFTSADAVQDFLIETGELGKLGGPLDVAPGPEELCWIMDGFWSGTVCQDPLTTLAGALAGEAVALTLNTAMDEANPDFSPSPAPLANLIYVNPWAVYLDGEAVGDILADLNFYIAAGGCSALSESGYDEMLLDAVQKINANFSADPSGAGYLDGPFISPEP